MCLASSSVGRRDLSAVALRVRPHRPSCTLASLRKTSFQIRIPVVCSLLSVLVLVDLTLGSALIVVFLLQCLRALATGGDAPFSP